MINLSMENVLNKNVTSTGTFDVQMVTAFDDKQIVVRVKLPTSEIKWTAINYMMVDGAYYYIDSVKHIANGLAELNGRIDLLMTYRDAIKQLSVLAERSTSHGSPNIADPLRAFEVGETVNTLVFPSIDGGESTGAFILSTSQNGYHA